MREVWYSLHGQLDRRMASDWKVASAEANAARCVRTLPHTGPLGRRTTAAVNNTPLWQRECVRVGSWRRGEHSQAVVLLFRSLSRNPAGNP